MNRLKTILLLLFSILLVLASCTSPTPTSTPTYTPTPTPAPTPTPTHTPTPTPTRTPALNVLTVHFIDVGQGDSILVDIGDTEILVDGGDRTPGVVNYINAYIDGALEVMVATHPHADHIGGLIAVLDRFEVKEIWLNGDISTSKTFSDFMNLVNAENAIVHEAERGKSIQVGVLTFTILHPIKPLNMDTNNNSIVLSLSYGDINFLFMGDAERQAESSMLSLVSDIEILKVGHHGSRSSSSPEFLNLAKPDIAIYMAGEGNSYGHPHKETMDALYKVGAKIYGTDTSGTIRITTEGKTYSVQTTESEGSKGR